MTTQRHFNLTRNGIIGLTSGQQKRKKLTFDEKAYLLESRVITVKMLFYCLFGADNECRTRVFGLGSRRSTFELHPQVECGLTVNSNHTKDRLCHYFISLMKTTPSELSVDTQKFQGYQSN